VNAVLHVAGLLLIFLLIVPASVGAFLGIVCLACIVGLSEAITSHVDRQASTR